MTLRTVALAGIAIALFVAACSGGGSSELTLVQYFDQVASIVDDLEERAASLMADVEGGIDAATARFDTACLAVVAIAEANSIANNISCEDDA